MLQFNNLLNSSANLLAATGQKTASDTKVAFIIKSVLQRHHANFEAQLLQKLAFEGLISGIGVLAVVCRSASSPLSLIASVRNSKELKYLGKETLFCRLYGMPSRLEGHILWKISQKIILRSNLVSWKLFRVNASYLSIPSSLKQWVKTCFSFWMEGSHSWHLIFGACRGWEYLHWFCQERYWYRPMPNEAILLGGQN